MQSDLGRNGDVPEQKPRGEGSSRHQTDQRARGRPATYLLQALDSLCSTQLQAAFMASVVASGEGTENKCDIPITDVLLQHN